MTDECARQLTAAVFTLAATNVGLDSVAIYRDKAEMWIALQGHARRESRWRELFKAALTGTADAVSPALEDIVDNALHIADLALKAIEERERGE